MELNKNQIFILVCLLIILSLYTYIYYKPKKNETTTTSEPQQEEIIGPQMPFDELIEPDEIDETTEDTESDSIFGSVAGTYGLSNIPGFGSDNTDTDTDTDTVTNTNNVLGIDTSGAFENLFGSSGTVTNRTSTFNLPVRFGPSIITRSSTPQTPQTPQTTTITTTSGPTYSEQVLEVKVEGDFNTLTQTTKNELRQEINQSLARFNLRSNNYDIFFKSGSIIMEIKFLSEARIPIETITNIKDTLNQEESIGNQGRRTLSVDIVSSSSVTTVTPFNSNSNDPITTTILTSTPAPSTTVSSTTPGTTVSGTIVSSTTPGTTVSGTTVPGTTFLTTTVIP